jgi:hypothetical protein
MRDVRAPFLRLRQVCLVASDLVREAARIQSLFGLEICYRDPNVAKYGLQNVLFPVGTSFLEIVSPTLPGTAAGRFLQRHGGRYGYMVILDCDDPERYRRRAEALGVRVANRIRHDQYLGVQLHPKDTGGAMLEFNSTADGADPLGPYAPAGPNWQRAIRTERVRSIAGVGIEAPDADGISARWASLLERPVQDAGQGRRRISLDAGAIDFVPSSGREEVFTTVDLEAVPGAEGVFEASGVRFRVA